MNNDARRFIHFMILSFLLIMGANLLLAQLGLLPQPPQPEPEAAAVKDQARPPGDNPKAAPAADTVAAEGEGEGVEPAAEAPAPAPAEVVAEPAPKPRPVEPVDPSRLVLGGTEDYALRVQLAQRGAGLESVHSLRFRAEYIDRKERNRPLTLVRRDPGKPAPLAIEALTEDEEGLLEPFGNLDIRAWEVVQPSQPILDENDYEIGQQAVLRTTLERSGGAAPVVVTKTYRLLKDQDTFQFALQFALPEDLPEPGASQSELSYRLIGPYGIPIEGEWYTYTFRDAFIGKDHGNGSITAETHSAYEIVKASNDPYRNTQLSVAFAGVENQYFAAFVAPRSAGQENPIAEATMALVKKDEKDAQKSDVTVNLLSRPVQVGPDQSPTHRFDIYAGPKTLHSLPNYAGELVSYRKGFYLWRVTFGGLAASLSRGVITPMLGFYYGVTNTVAGWFGGTAGSYGIAILMLTVTVRLLMFPLSRKQALSAKRMQDLQPHLMVLRDKYKDDQQKLSQEMFALYRKHGVNPLGGCLPALIQIPIFMSLWQALNNSVSLRQAKFLWIDNLAAPDMLFRLPEMVPQIPMIGGFIGPYFNILPLIVLVLMIFQTKLFTPPATTPEQEMQQKVFKFMMVIMLFFFYRVPSGLVLYFITSSAWAIGERLLLPKMAGKPAPPDEEGDSKGKSDSGGSSGPHGNGDSDGPSGRRGWFSSKLTKLMEKADQERTYRREALERGGAREQPSSSPASGREAGREGKKPRSKPKPKSKPGKRR
ncbi:hypothetical protein BH23PLA1_BH23PLA1_16310 [soil metagenome]